MLENKIVFIVGWWCLVQSAWFNIDDIQNILKISISNGYILKSNKWVAGWFVTRLTLLSKSDSTSLVLINPLLLASTVSKNSAKRVIVWILDWRSKLSSCTRKFKSRIGEDKAYLLWRILASNLWNYFDHHRQDQAWTFLNVRNSTIPLANRPFPRLQIPMNPLIHN